MVAVTPAFNASFSGLFKSFFDVLPEETLTDMPVMIAATGGTERHSLVLEHAMRPLFSYLHAGRTESQCASASGPVQICLGDLDTTEPPLPDRERRFW